MIGFSQGRRVLGMGKAALVAGLAILAVAGTNRAANAQLIYGFTDTNRLVSFNATTPGAFLNNVGITGIAGTLLDIDFRPANGLLYGLSFNAQAGALNLYTINTTSGVASLFTAGGLGSNGVDYDIDFNPTADALRIVGTNGDNFRVTNLNSSGSFNVDGGLGTTGIVGAAYTNNFAGAGSTQLYYLGNNGQLYTTGTPNTPSPLTPIGAPQANIATTTLGFDIAGANTAFVSANGQLFSENLAGTATSIGSFAGGAGNVRGIAVSAAPEPGSFVLLGTGLVSMGGIAVRRRKSKKA